MAPDQQSKKKLSESRRSIAAIYPQFRDCSIQPVNEEGQYNDAFVVDGRFIFRFPRYEAGIAMMRREVAFLKSIKGRTTLPVPEPAYVFLDAEAPGQVFMGYPFLHGQPLWRPTILTESDDDVLQIWAAQLACFLQELHALPVYEFETDGDYAESTGEWRAMYDEVRNILFPLMRADARLAVAAHFDTYLSDSTVQRYRPSPRHGDFGSGNILYDSASKKITGVIDFGYAAVGDPAMDVAAASTLSDALFSRFLAIYTEAELMMPRVRFYRGIYALFEALHGFKSGDRVAFEAGMAQYV